MFLIVGVVIGTLGVSYGVNGMGTRVSFGFYTLRESSRVYMRIMRTSYSRSCPCLLPMVSSGTACCGFHKYSMMSFAAF